MNAFLLSTLRYLRFAVRNVPVEGHAQRRDVRIVQGIFAGLAGRGVAAAVSFISVPLTVRYLGAERYGAWVTISTAMAWVALADFGLSNSLTNVVSEGYAKDRPDLAQAYVASAFWSLTAIAGALALGFFSVWRHVPWERVFNVQSVQAREEVAPAVAIAFAIFVLNFPFSTIAKIYGAYQEVAKGNAWAVAGNVVGLASLVAVTQLKGGLVSLVVAVSGGMLAVNIVSALWLFGYSKPWLRPHPSLVTWSSMRKLSSLGGMFFAIQIAALILFQTDNLIIAHYLGAAAVTPYSVTWRLFSYTWLFQVLAGPSYWPAYAEAFSRGDRAWVRRRFQTNLRITILSTSALALPLVVFGRWFIGKWAGHAAMPSTGLLIFMGIWSVIYTATCSQSCILASSSRLRGQMIYSAAAALVNILVSILLVQRIGLIGAILGTLIAYFTCILIPQWAEVERAIRDDSLVSAQRG
jgi:O-antigen/teichoic acid export membrane protein